MVRPKINSLHTIILQNTSFHLKLVRASQHSVRLSLPQKNHLKVSAPFSLSDQFILKFLQDKSAWILKHNQKIVPKKLFSRLKTISILGQQQSIPEDLKNNKTKFTSHYKNISRNLILEELERLCLTFNFSYNGLRLGNQRTRFGSCSHSNNLNFNWQIIFFPKIIFTHLLLHELVHTQVKNHQKQFWDFLTRCDPDTKKNNRWLKTYGAKSYLF